MKKTSFAVAILLVAGMASLVCADDTKKKTDAKDEKPKASQGQVVDGKKKTVAKGEKPKASPGWVVIEEEWWNPFLYDFSISLHNAREHYRAKEEKSASAEIDKAISWLKYAECHANKTTAEDLATAQADLMDFSARLKSGKPVLARQLDAAFAHASAALANYHHFKSGRALAEGDLKTAGRHLMAATDLLRSAAQSANLEYGSETAELYDTYAPYGYWDDTIVFEKSKLESNLTTLTTELEKLAAKLKSSK
ncbi:hypothetical protein [Singulisphaera acidiphila]|uniref:Lipoprotein n=1 Tax=Singulisphaera acidiphila (strain ATCC BAA-1392 / DSM 18658 / VKM B-2454 / MOB10) TaxID=886293 RepID=L0DAF5_SINAD|nr:hypothetical protein [Singulisphaera acidiphila]AGA26354.1 hypothetical protein Sinac_2005 [Singulisphaera acidiphila DSM 18658]